MLAASTMAAAAVAVPAFAATGTDSPQPCTVTYAATPHGAGRQITTAFDVTCAADPQWEITTLDQQTTIRDIASTTAAKTCDQQVSGTAATQTCSATGERLHDYLVTYRLRALGNYAVCADDGTCSPQTPIENPACVETETEQLGAAPTVVLDCTYRQLVTIGVS